MQPLSRLFDEFNNEGLDGLRLVAQSPVLFPPAPGFLAQAFHRRIRALLLVIYGYSRHRSPLHDLLSPEGEPPPEGVPARRLVDQT